MYYTSKTLNACNFIAQGSQKIWVLVSSQLSNPQSCSAPSGQRIVGLSRIWWDKGLSAGLLYGLQLVTCLESVTLTTCKRNPLLISNKRGHVVAATKYLIFSHYPNLHSLKLFAQLIHPFPHFYIHVVFIYTTEFVIVLNISEILLNGR